MFCERSLWTLSYQNHFHKDQRRLRHIALLDLSSACVACEAKEASLVPMSTGYSTNVQDKPDYSVNVSQHPYCEIIMEMKQQEPCIHDAGMSVVEQTDPDMSAYSCRPKNP